jgi:1-acyl-sn-glycerol-3-phosphate acyltransferase
MARVRSHGAHEHDREGRMEPVYVVVRTVLVAIQSVLFRFKAFGLEKVPPSGPAIIAVNHISYADPVMIAYLVDRLMKRRPRFLGKASLWDKWYLRFIMQGCGQIPVERGSGDVTPTRAAEAALRAGKTVVIYPEATITTNADLTPMAGKTGVARLTLATGTPVVPVAIWGAQWHLPKHRKGTFRRHRDIYFQIGDPMTFGEFAGRGDDREALREVTDRVMAEIDRLVRELQKVHPHGAAVPALKEAP